jgi:WD40 repeat protein
MNRLIRITSLPVIAVAFAACSEKNVSAPDDHPVVNASGVGSIEISVSTFGPDQDADGYLLSAQAPGSSQSVQLPTSGVPTVIDTEPRGITLLLYGLAPNCTLSGENPRVVFVNAGGITTVSYVVNCVASGSLRVTTVTDGEDPDTDGYSLVELDRSTIGSDISHSFTAGLDLNLSPNGTTTTRYLIPGTYRVAIRDVAPNCQTPASEPITIVAGVETSLFLEFTCVRPAQIAFVRGAGEEEWLPQNIAKTDIYLVNSNGTGTVRLTSEPGADLDPAWSPDGRKIVFASDRAGNREIYVMNADGSEPVRLTDNAAPDYRPAYSPDGKQIAFVSERDGNAQIYLMDVDGKNVIRLTNNAGADTEPAWSPDGSKIVFRRSGSLYVMNASGSGATRVTNSSDMQPAWSPDGKRIAFLSDNRNHQSSIWLMNADGSQITDFMDWNYWRGNPDWSPDGKTIAFDDRDCWDYGPCPRGIVIATVDGQYSIVINDAAEPAWRPR